MLQHHRQQEVVGKDIVEMLVAAADAAVEVYRCAVDVVAKEHLWVLNAVGDTLEAQAPHCAWCSCYAAAG